MEFVAKQSRMKPGGSKFAQDTVFVTNRRVIIRNPSIIRGREKIDNIAFNQITSIQLGKGMFSSTIKLRASGYQEDIEAIEKDKAEKIVEYVKQAIRNIATSQQTSSSSSRPNHSSLSLADELLKLSKLKEQGIISESEFVQMKQDVLKKLQ